MKVKMGESMAIVPFTGTPDEPTQPTIEGEFVEEKSGQVGGGIPQAPDSPLSIQFIATLAGVNTAAKPLNFDIDGGAKISLETDESQTPYVIALLALKRSRLLVTVVVDTSPVAVVVKKKRAKRVKDEPVKEVD
jgi:hypothetical protein